MMRKEFELTEEQLNKLLDASKPVPYMIIGNSEPTSPQESANRAWKNLGKDLGFDYMTVRPVAYKGNKFISAEELLKGGE